MKKITTLSFALLLIMGAKAQTTDSTTTVTVNKDPRLDILAKEEYDYNKATVGLGTRAAKGYRLLVVNSKRQNLCHGCKG
ncbi:MAG: hypothetical protein WDM90_19545 [Ferruginibacter sp.]